MNKTELYRVWDKQDKKMMTSEIEEFGVTIYPNGQWCVGNLISEKLGILMQYSGIKDKNKVKIFDGDIIVIRKMIRKITAVVEFERGSFVAGGEPLSNWTDIEKIGNKFKNKELLI